MAHAPFAAPAAAITFRSTSSSMAATALVCRCLRSSSSFAPLRAHGGRSFSAFSTSTVPQPPKRLGVFVKSSHPFASSLRFFSSAVNGQSATKAIAADENLLRVLDSEINYAMEADFNDQEVDIPDNFPFEIVDNPGDHVVILKQKFYEEDIQVIVMLDFNEEEYIDESYNADTNDDSVDANITLVANIDKGSGSFLEFYCSLNSDELKIESMVTKKSDNPDDENIYEGPEFLDLNENLQKALYKYLEVRGIKKSLFDFLQEYMLNKDEREYILWLKNMKQFIGN